MNIIVHTRITQTELQQNVVVFQLVQRLRYNSNVQLTMN